MPRPMWYSPTPGRLLKYEEPLSNTSRRILLNIKHPKTMDLFQQFSSYVLGGAQAATGIQTPFVHTVSPSSPQSLRHSLPLGSAHLPAVYVNNHAFAALPGEWSHDSLLTPFHSFTAPSPAVAAELATIKAAPYVAFDPAFFPVLGPAASLEKIHAFTSPDDEHVHEAPIYLPGTNELLFADTSVVGWLWALDITTATIRKIATTPPLPNVNGGTSHCDAHTSDCTLYLTTNGGTSPGLHACPLPSNFSTATTTLTCHPLLNNFRSRHLNSPNDLILTPSGDALLFTDPDYGWAQSWPGVGPPQLPNAVYRYDLRGGGVAALSVGVVGMPNGLALSADGETLFVADSGSIHAKGGKPIGFDQQAVRGVWAFDVRDGGARGAMTGGRLVHLVESGWPDGVRVSQGGLLIVAVVGGVDVVDVERGVLLGKINVGDDVIYNLEPVKARGPGEAVWLLTGKTGVYRAVISEAGLFRQ